MDLTALIVLIVPLVAGIFAGALLRNKKQIKLDKVSLAIIVILIFSLGFGIGSNDELLAAMPTVGFNALIIAVLVILFSIAFIKLGRKLVRV